MPIDNGGQIRFMTNNLLLTGVSSIVRSSENPSFPWSNALTDFRSRPFRFAGRFEITTTNNKLYFFDTIARTATIPIGEYTSRNAMATAVQTAMNLVSANYTVSWSSIDRRFVISNIAGHILNLSNQTNAIWLTLGFSSIIDTANGSGHYADLQRLHYPFEFIKIDFGYFPDIGFFGLIGDSSKVLNISAMANVKIQANTVDDFTSPPINITLTRKNRGIFKFFDDASYNYRFWRITFEDNNSTNEVEIGYLYLGEFGKYLDHYNAQGGVNSNEDRATLQESESGQIYAYARPKQRNYDSIAIQAINPTDMDFTRDIFDKFGISKPFFISIDPKLEITNNLDDTTFYCKFSDAPKFTHITRNLYNTDFKIKEWL